MSEYYSDLDRLKAAGLEYATNGIAAGEMMPMESPFSGEWADGLTGQDVLDTAGIKARFDALEDYEQDDVMDHWESGYYSAEWPGHVHNEYPHEPGYLMDCIACESRCHCAPNQAECVFDGEHNHFGHMSTFGTYWCDTCNSPYCNLA